MLSKNILQNIISIVISALFLALFIFLLPSILILLGALVLLSLIAAIVFRFMVSKGMIKTNFIYMEQHFQSRKPEEMEEIGQLKDVTNSNKYSDS